MRTRTQGIFAAVVAAVFMFGNLYARCQLAHGSMDFHWNEGAEDCKRYTEPPIQVHPYNQSTYIMRESLCRTFEAPFVYLLIGSKRAMLIDSGDVEDSSQMPLASTIEKLLASDRNANLPLLVVHTHRHLDHRAGDGQFSGRQDVVVVGYDLESVRRFYGFKDWPHGVSTVDLGGRVVDVLPTPGHNETELSFYDRDTAILFSGDFLMPGRLLVDNRVADLASARRLSSFAATHPISFVLGGHIEEDSAGKMYPWQSQYHSREHSLQLSKDDLVALPNVLETFNGFYMSSGGIVVLNSTRLLTFAAGVAVCILAVLLAGLVRWLRQRRQRSTTTQEVSNDEAGHLL